MRVFRILSALGLLASAMVTYGGEKQDTLVVTASNLASNQLLVYNGAGTLLQTLSTQGQGGVSGNAGGVAACRNLVAVVNFGSQSVALFERTGRGLQFRKLVPTLSPPVSVAFGNNHLYVLDATEVESHRIFGSDVSPGADGVAGLLKADGSAAQVGVVTNALVIAEKSNVIETVSLTRDGAANAPAHLVQNIPANVNTPFGLVTRSDNTYITLAHADEVSLVRDGNVLTTTQMTSFSGPVQHSPCWLALVGPLPLFRGFTKPVGVSFCGVRTENHSGRRRRCDFQRLAYRCRGGRGVAGCDRRERLSVSFVGLFRG